MKIIWRDDVRLERFVDSDGIRYAIPVVKRLVVPVKRKRRKSSKKRRPTRKPVSLAKGGVKAKVKSFLEGFADRQRARVLARALARKKALKVQEDLPVWSPLAQQRMPR